MGKVSVTELKFMKRSLNIFLVWSSVGGPFSSPDFINKVC